MGARESVSETIPNTLLQSPGSSVRLVEPINHYQQVTRSVKHALFVLVLTFATFFLFELLASLNIHPIQYLLVGCALTLFYLLLLSLTEHVSFPLAYLIACGAVVSLVTSYAHAMLQKGRRALGFGLGLGSSYGLLYVILREDTLALLAGSWTLFVVLALLMFLTRNVDFGALTVRKASSKS